MLFIDYGGETIALLLAQPNWAQPVTLELSLPFTDITKGISARESRKVFGLSSRYSFAYSVWLPDTETCTDFRLWINRLKGETLAVPLWTDQIILSASSTAGATSLTKSALMPARYGAEWIIVSPDFSTFEIVTVSAINSTTVTLASPGTTLSWPANTKMFPLLFGKFSDRPKAQAVTPEKSQVDFSIQENSPWIRRINPTTGVIPVVGAGIPAFSTKRLWDISPNYERPLDDTEVDIAYKAIGFLRQEQQYEYQQPARRGVEFTFTHRSRDDIAKIERMLSDRRGTLRNFFVPTVRSDLKLTQDLPISGHTSWITIENSRFSDPDYAEHPGHPYIALIESSAAGLVVDPQKLTDVSGGTLTTQVPIAVSHTKVRTLLAHLILGRFAEAKVSWTYVTPSRANCQIRFVEVPDEYNTPLVEITPRGFLYEFTELTPEPQIQRFTSYEQTLSYTAQLWTPAPFSHGSIKKGVKLDREEVDITSWGANFPTNPLRKFLPYALEGELMLRIIEVNAENPSDGHDKVLFAGKITKPELVGVDWKATARSFGKFLERNVPRFYFQKVCNVPVYSPLPQCGVDRADFLTIGTIIGQNDTEIDIATVDDLLKAGYFGGGLFNTGTGVNYESRPILQSVTLASLSLPGTGYRITLDRGLRLAEDDQAVNIYPGCNGAIQTCVAVFNNLANFKGHAYIPVKNPSANIGETQNQSAGKKG